MHSWFIHGCFLIVRQNSVLFTVSSDLATSRPGMTAGTFELRGGVDETEASEKSIFLSNAKIIYDTFGGRGCTGVVMDVL